MSLEAQRAYVEQHVADFMAANYVGVPVAYENVPFVQPDGVFGSLFIMEGQSFRANLGKTYVIRHPGIIQFDAYQPENTGTSTVKVLAEAIGDLFKERGVNLSDGSRLVFRTPSLLPSPQAKGFARQMVRVGYYRDEMVTA